MKGAQRLRNLNSGQIYRKVGRVDVWNDFKTRSKVRFINVLHR